MATLLISSAPSFAMFCPGNFNDIELGDTLQKVEATCGPPTLKKTYKNDENLPQEWTYFVQIPTYGMPPAINNNPGTLKVTVAFVEGKATNLTSNGIGVGATAICNNINLQIGSTIEEVKKACGTPALITKTNQAAPNGDIPEPIEITEWTYTGTPTVVFTFEKGLLKARN